MAISFYFETRTKLTKRRQLKRFLSALILREKAKVKGLSFIFCSDIFLLDINIKYLNHDYFTDIITFPIPNEQDSMIDGEIYISVDRVSENANKYNTSFETELYRVIFHGLLHLCGYKDKTSSQKTEMRKMEDFYLNKYKAIVPRGT